MENYTSFDYLCNEPFLLPDIGAVRCPTLRDIRHITYSVFSVYLNLISIPFYEYLSMLHLNEQYQALSAEEKEKNSMFYLLVYGNYPLIAGMLHFFLTDAWEFDRASASFLIYEKTDDPKKEPIGHLGNDNFDSFRESLQCILGLKQQEEAKPKFKNQMAKQLYEKLQATPSAKNKDDSYTLDNMVRKYCTHNKVGINLLNVWDLTYYQFIRMFAEYTSARQYDFNDMMAANTFSYKNSADYHPLDYIKVTH